MHTCMHIHAVLSLEAILVVAVLRAHFAPVCDILVPSDQHIIIHIYICNHQHPSPRAKLF